MIYPLQNIADKIVTKISVLFFIIGISSADAQTVSEIITDYNGFYKSGNTNINTTRPDHSHNLLAFTFNGTRYSTGVNDALLTAHKQEFTEGMFQAMPMHNLTGSPTGNTKIGLGAMADGVYNGAGTPPSRNLSQYLVDGPNGLDLGTCVANLPAGTMFMSVTNLQTSNIGDGVPDILVTQVADPSSKFDRYCFTDINGNMIGNYVDINLTNIPTVGQWMADFYEATGSSVLASNFTQTHRQIRLWAADFNSFGINESNISEIAYFKIVLSGDSDIAFVAYNSKTMSVNNILDIPATQKLTRTLKEEVKTTKLYPNPAKTGVNFIHPSADRNASIQVYNMNGVLVLQTKVAPNVTQTKLNISFLNSGAYQITYTNGFDKYSEKLLVQ